MKFPGFSSIASSRSLAYSRRRGVERPAASDVPPAHAENGGGSALKAVPRAAKMCVAGEDSSLPSAFAGAVVLRPYAAMQMAGRRARGARAIRVRRARGNVARGHHPALSAGYEGGQLRRRLRPRLEGDAAGEGQGGVGQGGESPDGGRRGQRLRVTSAAPGDRR